MQSAADANTEESTVAVPPSKYPSDAQVIEMLRKKKADPAWGMFHIDKSRKGEVYCSFCKASIRGWENDVKKHMTTQCHKMKAHGPMVQCIPLPGSKKRTATEVSAPSHDIFLAHTLIHAEASGISYHAARRFLSPPFLTALHKHGKDLPTSSQMRRKYFNPAVSIVQESVDELISDTPYTILVDAYKLLAMRAGISGVERQFKLLRDIQLPQRNCMQPATLEGLFLMRANAHVCDPYARTAEERSEDEQE